MRLALLQNTVLIELVINLVELPKLLVYEKLKINKSQSSMRVGLHLGKKKKQYKSKPPSFTQTKYMYNVVKAHTYKSL